MKRKLLNFLKDVPGVKPAYYLACRLFLGAWRMRKNFAYDRARFLKFSPNSRGTKAGALAAIVMSYHIIEKGADDAGLPPRIRAGKAARARRRAQ